MCGADKKNSIFDLSEVDPTIYKDASEFGESYIGCFIEDAKDRDLPSKINEGYQNYQNCLRFAAAKKFKYAGLQNRGECWAGNHYGKHSKKEDWCNGKYQNSIFSLNNKVIGETYVGCFKNSKDRVLPYYL